MDSSKLTPEQKADKLISNALAFLVGTLFGLVLASLLLAPHLHG